MDSYQNLLDAHDARKAADLKLKKAAQQRYENAAKKAHAFRCNSNLLKSVAVLKWDEMAPVSQRHLIADAENVAANPTITANELNRLYKERLTASGDTDSLDLGEWAPDDLSTEEQVLEELKKYLADS